MNHKIFLSITLASLSLLSSCEKEDAFVYSDEVGKLNCRSLDVNYIGGGQLVRAAETSVSPGDFTIDFLKEGETTPAQSYIYASMPEVVTLPKGNYKISAHYGQDLDKAWDQPYYYGEYDGLQIVPNQISTVPEVITCKLSNIKIKVNVDDQGSGLISDDYNVHISVGAADTYLDYNKDTKGKVAYFKYIDDSSTITADFTGTVDGNTITEPISVVYTNAAPGNAYTINFTVTKPENGSQGNVSFGDTSINIDTNVNVINETVTANPDVPNDDIITDYDRDNDRNNPSI